MYATFFYPPLTCHSVTEQPYKIPFYAALLRLLYDPAPSETETAQASGSSSVPSLGKLVLEDFWKGFQGYLDKLAWRDIRLCVRPTRNPITLADPLTRYTFSPT